MAADAPFDVDVREDDSVTVVTVSGDVDLATSPRLRDALDRALSAPDRTVRLDMSQVTFLDSSGISVLVDARQRLHDGAGTLVLHGVGDRVKRVLEISGLGSFFELSDRPAT